jgi:hypothetical protein
MAADDKPEPPAQLRTDAGGGAPTFDTWMFRFWSWVTSRIDGYIGAEYIVASPSPVLPGARALTDTASVTWDFSTPAQAKANVPAEFIQDTVGALAIDSSSIDVTYNDGANTLAFAIIDEYVQDLVGALVIDSATIDATYNDGANTLALSVITQMSVTSDSSGVKLVGDVTTPGNNFYYGTNPSGTRGWYGPLVGGVYTPTLTNVTNVAASTAFECQYMQVGATVTVSGRVDIDPTAAGAVELGISLPVASNFGALEDCAGVASTPAVATGEGAAILADVANDRASCQYIAVDTANRARYFTFTYQVI